MIRKANKSDIKRIIELLHQVNMVHHVLRPDLFKPHTTMYHEQELEDLLNDESRPIFGSVRKKAICRKTDGFLDVGTNRLELLTSAM